jgi:hypothetical protein
MQKQKPSQLFVIFDDQSSDAILPQDHFLVAGFFLRLDFFSFAAICC